jgi:deoxyribonuclease IV
VGRIGAHVSCGRGLTSAVEKALDIGAECLQIFVGAPQNWASPKIPDEEVDAFRAALEAASLQPLFVHAPYLINLASLRPEVRGASRRALVEQLGWADKLGAQGVIVHVGSGGEDAMEKATSGLREVLSRHAGGAWLILENDAGSGNRIGRRFAEIGALIRETGGDERVRVCVDTAHSLAAGYELRTPEGLESTVDEVEREIGLSRLALVHANDSKVDLGRNVDRHDNIGRGTIGLEAFARILAHPSLRDLPFVLEVPGYDGEGPDVANVEALRRLAAGEIPILPEVPAEPSTPRKRGKRSTAPRPSSPPGTASSG